MLAQVNMQTQAYNDFEEYFALQSQMKQLRNQLKILEQKQEKFKKAIKGYCLANGGHFVCGEYQAKQIAVAEKVIPAYNYVSITGG